MKLNTLLYCLLAILLGGCVPSLHPLYTDKELIFEEKLLGTWSDNDPGGKWEFKKVTDSNSYLLTITDDEGTGSFDAHLVKLNQMLFLDIYPKEAESLKTCGFWTLHILPVHTFMKIE